MERSRLGPCKPWSTSGQRAFSAALDHQQQASSRRRRPAATGGPNARALTRAVRTRTRNARRGGAPSGERTSGGANADRANASAGRERRLGVDPVVVVNAANSRRRTPACEREHTWTNCSIRRSTARLFPSSERVLRRQLGPRLEPGLRGSGAGAACRGSRGQ